MEDLTTRQLDGLDCVICGRPLDQADSPWSVPIARGVRGQLFACPPCAQEHATSEITPQSKLDGYVM